MDFSTMSLAELFNAADEIGSQYQDQEEITDITQDSAILSAEDLSKHLELFCFGNEAERQEAALKLDAHREAVNKEFNLS